MAGLCKRSSALISEVEPVCDFRVLWGKIEVSSASVFYEDCAAHLIRMPTPKRRFIFQGARS
jgi:hypothetical protein